MTKEEAAELVLKGQPWGACKDCNGSGCIGENGLRICATCNGDGFLLKMLEAQAYEMVGATLPTKPLTGRELVTKTMDIRSQISARRFLPVQQIPDDVLDEYLRRNDRDD